MEKLYHAVRAGKNVGDGTVGALVDWLERYINILFQNHGIEWWHCPDRLRDEPYRLKRSDPVPDTVCRENGIHHIACYAHRGSCEGWMIEVCLTLRSGERRVLASIKSFSRDHENWQIARSIYLALEDILLYEQVPQIVELASKMPGVDRWFRETSLHEAVTITTTPWSFTVMTASGDYLDSRNFSQLEGNAKFSVEALVNDWKTVLTNLKVNFTVAASNELHIPDLPGYVISKRDVEDIDGYYVLPPGCNPNDDRQYLGYFGDADKAISAARNHRDAATRKAA